MPDVISRLRYTGLAGALMSVFTFSAIAGTRHEPLGFTPPPNLLQAIQEARTKASVPNFSPTNVELPTHSGVRISAYYSSINFDVTGSMTMTVRQWLTLNRLRQSKRLDSKYSSYPEFGDES